jgi:hypothetical protein
LVTKKERHIAQEPGGSLLHVALMRVKSAFHAITLSRTRLPYSRIDRRLSCSPGSWDRSFLTAVVVPICSGNIPKTRKCIIGSWGNMRGCPRLALSPRHSASTVRWRSHVRRVATFPRYCDGSVCRITLFTFSFGLYPGMRGFWPVRQSDEVRAHKNGSIALWSWLMAKDGSRY